MNAIPWLEVNGKATVASTKSPPWMLKYRSSTWFIVATVCLSIFTVSAVEWGLCGDTRSAERV